MQTHLKQMRCNSPETDEVRAHLKRAHLKRIGVFWMAGDVIVLYTVLIDQMVVIGSDCLTLQ